MNTTIAARFAAPAPLEESSQDDEPELVPGIDTGHLHELFEAWSYWSRSRRYYCPPPQKGTILGQLSSKTRGFSGGVPDIKCNMELAALHLAILGQPVDALDTQVFYAYYGYRVRYIKCTAEEMGISRAHFYRLLKAFCARTYTASKIIVKHSAEQRDALPNYVGMV